jgi:predicted Zn-dependent protease
MHVFDEWNNAREEMAAGDYPAAETRLRALIAAEPRMIEARVTLGELALRSRRPEQAVAELSAAAALAPDDPTIDSALATALIEAGQPQQALALVRVLMTSQPEEPRNHYLAGRALLAQGQLPAAKIEFENARRINPRSSAALVELAEIAIAEKQPQQGRELATQALAVDGRARGARLALAQALEQSGDREGAWKEASAELREWPDDFRPAYYLGELAPKAGHDEQAEQYLRDAIRIEPRFAASYLLLAQRLLRRNERFDEGIRLTRKALELKPRREDQALAYFLLADFYSRLGHDELSRENAERGRRLSAPPVRRQ